MTNGPLSYGTIIAIELLGISITTIGIATEISTGAEIGHAIITGGSVLIALGSILWAKIFKIGGKNDD